MKLCSNVLWSLSALVLAVAPSDASVNRIGGAIADTASSNIAVWVHFTDKPAALPGDAATPGALARRRAAGFRADNAADRPIPRQYIQAVERAGGRLRQYFKWDNAASFDVPAGAVKKIGSLSFVKTLTLVGTLRRREERFAGPLGKKKMQPPLMYGAAYKQLAELNVPLAHDYLFRRYPEAPPGSGVRIAFFDSGFRLRHRCFRHLFERGAIAAVYDFVDRDTVVEDPDSVFRDIYHPYNGNDEHGSLVFSLVAGYDPPYYCGVAWGADFLLARTEDSYKYEPPYTNPSREVHAEEDNWAAAVVWAESLGVDIISSSVAYRTDFEDSVVIDRGGGVFDTLVSYARSDLDGRTTIVSRAAAGAIARGIVIVNSVGNEGLVGDTTLDAPSDVDGVIAVGMTTLDGFVDWQSSSGPSADGRLKPDVVAPGSGVFFPDVYRYDFIDTLISDDGSSYAAPLVAGVCALIGQANPALSAAELRERLFRYCRLPLGRSVPDFRCGRGIPDALLAGMRDGEVFLTAVDIAGKPLTGAIVENGQGDTVGRFDSVGVAICSNIFGDLAIRKGAGRRSVRIDSTPCRKALLPCTLLVRVLDDRRHVVVAPTLGGSIGSTLVMEPADSLGHLRIVDFFQTSVRLVATKDGYLPSDTVIGELTGNYQEIVATMRPSTSMEALVFPTIIRRGNADRLHIRCTIPLSTTVFPRLTAEVRSLRGDLIWGVNHPVAPPLTEFEWDCRTSSGASVSPGAYFVLVRFGGKKLQRIKIIITP